MKTSKQNEATMKEFAPSYKNECNERRKHVVSIIDCVLVTFSLAACVVDSATDVLVGVQYLEAGQVVWGSLTFVFVIIPCIVIQVFSARWYTADNKFRGWYMWLVHILQLQPLERYIQALRHGALAYRSCCKEEVGEYFYQQNDVSMLRLFEAFLESAPQLCLQIYIILCTEHAHWLTVTSAVVSLVTLGWAVAAYSHALRRAYSTQYRFHWPGLLLQTLWHMSMAASRVAAIVAFCAVFDAWIFAVLGFHWAVMTVWIILQKTDFCPSRWEELLFDGVVGIIYCFCFFNLKEGSSRWRLTAFYTLMIAENAAMVGVWYAYRDDDLWYNTYLLITVPTAFILGLVCLGVYYSFCHPNGRVSCWSSKLVINRHNIQPSTPAKLPNKLSTTTQLGVHPLTSTCQLPRRTLLKCSHAQLPIAFREADTPITPIKPLHHLAAQDTTLPLAETSAFQHYSVDAAVVIGNHAPSMCDTLDVSGVDLSRDSLLGGSDCVPRALFVKEDQEDACCYDDEADSGVQALSPGTSLQASSPRSSLQASSSGSSLQASPTVSSLQASSSGSSLQASPTVSSLQASSAQSYLQAPPNH